MSPDAELDQILADEIEARLHLLQPNAEVPHTEVRAALHSLRGATAMAGHLELSVLLAQVGVRLRRGEPGVLSLAFEVLSLAAARLRDGQPPLATRWPQPPPGLVALPLEEGVRAEYVATMRDRLEQLDEVLSRTDESTFDEAYRIVHGMKSTAVAAGDDATGWFCHGLESLLLTAPRDGAAAEELRAPLMRHRDALALMLEEPDRALEALRARASGPTRPPSAGPPSTRPPSTRPPSTRPPSTRPPSTRPPSTRPPSTRPPSSQGRPATKHPSVAAPAEVRVSTVAIDRVVERLTTIELVEDDLRTVAELGQRGVTRLRKLRSRLLEVPRLTGDTELTAVVEELSRGLGTLAVAQTKGLAALRRAAGQLRGTSRDLQKELTALRLTDAGWLFQRACRGLRDQATLEDKAIRIVTSGEDIPIERPLAEKVLGAVSQLVRNAVAHGIEPVEVRSRQGKPAEGCIELRASRTTSSLRIEVSDDGRGVDLEALRRTARSLGMDPEQAVHAAPEQELLTLLALPGLTTRDEADLLAGRGMGLHMAQQTLLSVGGSLTLQSRPQQGLSAWLDVPIDGPLAQVVWIETAGMALALPAQCVESVTSAEVDPPSAQLTELMHLKSAAPGAICVRLMVEGLPLVSVGVDRVGEMESLLIHPVPPAVRQAGPFGGAVRSADGTLHLVLDGRALAGLAMGAAAPVVEPWQPEDRPEVVALAQSEGLSLDPEAEAQRKHALFRVIRVPPSSKARGYLLAWQVADELELLQLVVEPTFRRQGLGSRLLDWLLAHGRKVHATAIHLEVRASNEAAIGLYRSRGFVEQSRRSGYYTDGEDAVLMSAHLVDPPAADPPAADPPADPPATH